MIQLNCRESVFSQERILYSFSGENVLNSTRWWVATTLEPFLFHSNKHWFNKYCLFIYWKPPNHHCLSWAGPSSRTGTGRGRPGAWRGAGPCRRPAPATSGGQPRPSQSASPPDSATRPRTSSRPTGNYKARYEGSLRFHNHWKGPY